MDIFAWLILVGIIVDWFLLRRRYARDSRWVERMESWFGLSTDEQEQGND